MREKAAQLDFLTNHARVLIVIAGDPGVRLRDIAAACDITERTAQNIVSDLERAGYLRRERDGRRTRYILRLDGTLRHPADAHVSVRALLELFTHPRRLVRFAYPEGQRSSGGRGDPGSGRPCLPPNGGRATQTAVATAR
ncbi:MarR family transcriptional regulator [Streptomyces sp. NPDC127036]|uniref:MarR family transcriptional regulator n=1 Tax=unclassified Streptomyces TaxID=2593676 RepID=UPI003653F549